MNNINTMPAILLVEDNPADQRLTQRALKRGSLDVKLIIVNDGQEAMDYLLGNEPFSNRTIHQIPDLILLDINMPRMDGFQVLKEIREHETLRTVPVIMLTTSSHERDVIESYQLGVNAYINKPVQIEEFIKAILRVEDFWLKLSILPTYN